MENEDYRDVLESKRLEIIQHLQIDRNFVFDYLRHKEVLDGEDCELILSEKTTSSKIGKFIDVLSRKGPMAYQHLLESLQLEHPVLYEKLTGNQADATTSPILMKLKKSFIGDGGPLVNSELEILTRHLERTYGDLHEMSRRFEQVVQRKKDIEEKLETTTTDLERQKETVDLLKRKINKQKVNTLPGKSNDWSQFSQFVESMRKEISDRDIYIIALQTNLMSSREEVTTLNKKNENLLAKNDELHKMVEEMNESYQRKKCESMRLSERVERQGNEIKNAELTMRKYRECQFHNMRLREEKDHLQEELDELKKWTEALKTRYDIVENEKKKTLSDHTDIMADYGTLQEELMKCREEMNEVQLNAADLKDRVRHLEQDRQTLKRQRDGAFTARREAILDRDKAFLERDQAFKKCNEIKERQDAAIEKKILQLKNFDEIVARCDVMEEEINHIKMKYRQTLRQLHEMKGKYGIEEDQLNEISSDKEKSAISQCEINITNDLKKEAQGNLSDESGNTKRSSSNTIVESIKRRVTSPSTLFGNPDPPNFPTPPGYMGSSLPRTEHMVYPFLHSYRSPTNPPKDATSKEGGLDRKGLTRMPIKMKQNGRDDTVTRWSSNESLGQSSTFTEEHTEEATFTTTTATVMHNGEHERVQRVNGDEDGEADGRIINGHTDNNKVIRYL